jgi:phenylacetate-CoA ligase
MHPIFVRKLFYPLHEYSKGKPTFDWLPILERSQWLTREEILTDQNEALRHFIQYAYEHVPYYRRVMDERAIRPQSIQVVEDLKRFPYLTRDDLRRHFNELQSFPRPPRTQTISTGGSTGAPATVLVAMESHGFAEAARLRAHGWFGLKPGDREMVLWGSPIELGRQSRWREVRDRFLNSRLLSAFDLSDGALAQYVNEIGRFRPQKLYGYASALAFLASYMLKTGTAVDSDWPKAIFTTAEPLLPHQRQAIQEAFHCPAVVEYGSRDAGLVAHECPAGRLHLNAERILVEIDEDKQFGVPGKGEIVITNLLSTAMPLIRYRTGDVGQLDSSECTCGRGLPLLSSVEGRRTDFLVTPSGRVLHALAIIYPIREAPGVVEFQVVQDTVREIVIRLVTDSSFSDSASATLLKKARLALGGEVSVEIEKVPTIPRLPSGKFRYVVSSVAEKLVTANGVESPASIGEIPVDVG